MKLEKKFYIASGVMVSDQWGHETLEAAVEHATRLAEEKKSSYRVVQVLKVVKLAAPPIVVEDVE